MMIKHLSTLLHKLFSEPPRQPHAEDKGDLYFCRSDHCLIPFKLEEAMYGCGSCDLKDCNEWNALPGQVKVTLGGQPHNIFDSSAAVKCDQPMHGSMPLRPRCPACGDILGCDDNGRPIALFAGWHSGKTVYSAALAHELNQPSFFQKTGIALATPHGRGYLARTVQPLFYEGVLPAHTPPGESHKIVFRFDMPGRGSRQITLTDMAGEQAIKAKAGKEAEITNQGFYARESIFLLNPQAVAGAVGVNPLAGLVAGDVFHGVKVFIEVLQKETSWLDPADIASVEILCSRAESELKDAGFPTCVEWEDLARHLLQQAGAQLDQAEFDEEVVKLLEEELQNTAAGLTEQPAFDEQLEERYEFLRKLGVLVVGDQLQHKLAVVFSKADLLSGHYQPDWHKLEALLPAKGAGHGDWGVALEKINGISREFLVNTLGMEEIVRMAERYFSRVGFFFVSNLGRDTEIKVRKNEAVGSQNPDQGHVIGSAAQQGQTGQGKVNWLLSPLVKKGADGSRAPAPRGVLNPLLWLLLTD